MARAGGPSTPSLRREWKLKARMARTSRAMTAHLNRPRAARHRGDTRARHLGQTQRPHQLDERIELVRRTRHLEGEALRRRAHDAGAERIAQPQRLGALLARAD